MARHDSVGEVAFQSVRQLEIVNEKETEEQEEVSPHDDDDDDANAVTRCRHRNTLGGTKRSHE